MDRGSDRADERHHMVARQLVPRGIADLRVLEAMRKVPRHHFVPAHVQPMAYDDSPLPIGEGQTISQPYIVALMAECANISSGDKVLEIGTGSGYSAAVLAELGVDVYTVERLPHLSDLARQRLVELGYGKIHCLVGDGSLGWLKEAPYDAIIVTAGAPSVPHSLRQQLAVEGTLVIPVGDSSVQSLLKIKRMGEAEYDEQIIEGVRFVPLIGKEGW